MDSLKRVIVSVGILGGLVGSASAGVTYGFDWITNNGNGYIGGQLSMLVDTGGSGKVSFKFVNSVGTKSNVEQIFFDLDDTLTAMLDWSDPVLTDTDGPTNNVNFASDGSPGNLPGGNSLSPQFDEDYSAAANNPAPKNGLNESADSLTITFDLLNSSTLQDILNCLNNGGLRVGMHVTGIGTAGGSDSYVNTVTIVPTPAAGLLGICGLLFSGMFRRR